MIENLQDKLYQLEYKQAKDAKFCANIKQELQGKKYYKTFFKVLERQNMQSQTISELYTDGRNIFATLMTFSNLQNISIKNFL